MTTLLRRFTVAIVTVALAYVVLLAYPQPLFAYQLKHAGITVYATTPIPDAMRTTLDRVRARINRSPLIDPARHQQVFICDTPWVLRSSYAPIIELAASRTRSSASMCS